MVDRQVVEDIRRRVSPREVLDMEGLPVNRQGFALCPFHGDKNPSLKVYGDGRGWYCFGCHAGGDVIGLVQHLHRLTFPQALTRLNVAFGLGLSLTHRKTGREAHLAALREEGYKCRMAWLEAEIERKESDYWAFFELWLDCQRRCDYARARVDHGGEFTEEDATDFWRVEWLREAAQEALEAWKEAMAWRPLMREG